MVKSTHELQRKRAAKKKSKPVVYTKRFMTELQSTIAYGAYDSKEILGAGESSSQRMLADKMSEIYFPSTDPDDPRVSHVELFLEREQKYKFLFEETDKGVATIPETLHQLKGKEITVEDDCVNVSMLTRKNLSNPIDISSETLFRHAKDVEANAKKAFALCTSASSPYKDFKGSFASGTTWETYIEWVRVEMFKILEEDKIVEVIDEDDPDALPSVSVDESDKVKDDSNKKKSARKKDESDEDFDPDEDDDDDGDEDDGESVAATIVTKDNDDTVPYDWIFKGYIAFALWGHIHIPGGEKYKSLLMSSIDGEEKVKGGTRKELRNMKTARAAIDRLLEKRGDKKDGDKKDDAGAIDKQLADLLMKGRLETQKQKMFQSKVDQFQYQIDFINTKMRNIKDELDMLDSDDAEGKKELKKQWKKCKDEREAIFQKLTELTQAENSRREGVQVEWDESKDAFDNATCLTMDTSLHVQHTKSSPTKAGGSTEKVSAGSQQTEGADINMITSQSSIMPKDAPSNQNASQSFTIITNVVTNSHKEKTELVENAIGVLPTGKCSFCVNQSSHHYCREERSGTNTYLRGKEVCGKIMCHLCILEWPGSSEEYRGVCVECKERNDKKDKEHEKEAVQSKAVSLRGVCKNPKNTKAKATKKGTSRSSTNTSTVQRRNYKRSCNGDAGGRGSRSRKKR